VTLSSGPARHPHPPEAIFDALWALLPASELQVVWADRALGVITTVSGPGLVADELRHTIHVRVDGPSGSTVVVQVNGRATHKGLGRRNPQALDVALALVARAVDQLDHLDRRPPR
jgi:hypothetical protein